MTLLQVTAVAVNRTGPPCCLGLVQTVGIGPGRRVTSVQALAGSPSLNREAFYAIIDGQFADLVTGYCAGCGAAYLTTDLQNEAGNALLNGFETLGGPRPTGLDDAANTVRWWWWRRKPAR